MLSVFWSIYKRMFHAFKLRQTDLYVVERSRKIVVSEKNI